MNKINDNIQSDKGFQSYLNIASDGKLLTREQEVEISKRFKQEIPNPDDPDSPLLVNIDPMTYDGKQARDLLLSKNLRLVIAEAKKYMGRGLDLEDLIQEGNIGLMRAADKFDYRLGWKYSTYACVPTSTQILTRRGWKYHYELQEDDEAVGNSYGWLLWTPINQVVVYEDAPLVQFKSESWSTLCTPQHKWLVFQDNNYQLIPLDELDFSRKDANLILRANCHTITNDELKDQKDLSFHLNELSYTNPITYGQVWCPSTDLGSWIAKDKDNNIYITGNTYWIRQAITRALADQSRLIRIPVHVTELTSKIAKSYKDKLGQKKYITPEDIAEDTEIDIAKVRLLMEVTQTPMSINAPVNGTDLVMSDLLAAPEEDDTKELSGRILDHLDLALISLPEREQQVLKMRHGLGMSKERTLEDAGQRLGITRERVRQIEIRALRRLRANYIIVSDG